MACDRVTAGSRNSLNIDDPRCHYRSDTHRLVERDRAISGEIRNHRNRLYRLGSRTHCQTSGTPSHNNVLDAGRKRRVDYDSFVLDSYFCHSGRSRSAIFQAGRPVYRPASPLGFRRWVDRYLSNIIDRALRRYTRLEVRDYANLIHLAENYRIVELQVSRNDWLAKKTLAQARLRDEGIVVLGIERANGSYLGVPHGEICIEPEDTLILYGRESGLDNIDERRADLAGARDHQNAVATQNTVAEREKYPRPPVPRGADERSDTSLINGGSGPGERLVPL